MSNIMTDTQYIENVEKVLVEVHQISLVNISLPNPMHRMLPVQFSCIKFQFSCIKYNLEMNKQLYWKPMKIIQHLSVTCSSLPKRTIILIFIFELTTTDVPPT